MSDQPTTEFPRRQFITGAAAALSGLMLPPFAGRLAAQDAPKLRRDAPLPDPDFSKLRAPIVGVRPYRRGGVRLELMPAPIANAGGQAYLIHNYGHGGAGITLSWGCASVVVDHIAAVTLLLQQARRKPSVAIMGAGVIGLTVATELRRRWPQLPITIYARDFVLSNTTSFRAGGQFEPSGIHRDYQTPESKKVLHEWLRRSRDRVVGIQRSGQREAFGVAERFNYTLDHVQPGFDLLTESAPGQSQGVLPEPTRGLLPFNRLRLPGREYRTWLINPTILLPKLVADLKGRNVQFKVKRFDTQSNVAELKENIIVNCTGLGAGQLFVDPDVIPKRGLLAVLRKTDPRQFYFVSGGCTPDVIDYIFCRQNDIVVGGTVEPGRTGDTVTDADRPALRDIVGRARALFEGDIARCVGMDPHPV
jgi:D-amino-acid oxidase